MGYKSVIEAAINDYMAGKGFEYDEKNRMLYKPKDDDVEYAMSYDITNSANGIYDVLIRIYVFCKSWNDLLFQLTDGRLDYNKIHYGMVNQYCPPAFQEGEPTMKFVESRNLEDNMKEFADIINAWAKPFWINFSDKELIDVALYLEFSWQTKRQDCYVLPIASYTNQNYDQAIQYLKMFKFMFREDAIMEGKTQTYYEYKKFYKNFMRLIRHETRYSFRIWHALWALFMTGSLLGMYGRKSKNKKKSYCDERYN